MSVLSRDEPSRGALTITAVAAWQRVSACDRSSVLVVLSCGRQRGWVRATHAVPGRRTQRCTRLTGAATYRRASDREAEAVRLRAVCAVRAFERRFWSSECAV